MRCGHDMVNCLHCPLSLTLLVTVALPSLLSWTLGAGLGTGEECVVLSAKISFLSFHFNASIELFQLSHAISPLCLVCTVFNSFMESLCDSSQFHNYTNQCFSLQEKEWDWYKSCPYIHGDVIEFSKPGKRLCTVLPVFPRFTTFLSSLPTWTSNLSH